MPISLLFCVSLIVSVFWMALCLERKAWASIILCLALDIAGIYGLNVVFENRPYETVTKTISIVDNKPVIFIDDTIILLAKNTGEMYNPGDIVTFKYMSNKSADRYFLFDNSVEGRIRDIKTVGGESKTGEVK